MIACCTRAAGYRKKKEERSKLKRSGTRHGGFGIYRMVVGDGNVNRKGDRPCVSADFYLGPGGVGACVGSGLVRACVGACLMESLRRDRGYDNNGRIPFPTRRNTESSNSSQ